jgi:hypothetical protein
MLATMNEIDVTKLSLSGVKLLKAHCEELIEACQADLAEYDLYIRCQTELVRRGALAKKPLAGRRDLTGQAAFR